MAMNKARRRRLTEGLAEEVEHDRIQSQTGKTLSLVPTDVAKLWQCKNGEHFIDVLPYFAGKNHPDKDKGQSTYKFRYFYHRNVGVSRVNILCLKLMGYGDCPICDHQAELIADDADQDKWEALTPKPRLLYNIVCYDKGEEDKGVQVWDESEFNSQDKIMAIAKKRARSGKPSKIIDFANPDKGKSISFEKIGAKGPNSYPKYKGFTFERRDYSIKDRLLDECYVLDELIPIPTEEQVKALYYGVKGKSGSRYVEEEDVEDKKDPMVALEDADDVDDLIDLIDEYDLDIGIARGDKFGKVRRKIKRALERMMDEPEEDELTLIDLKEKTWKELKKLIKEKDLDLDLDDYDDEEELSEAIAKELDIE